MIAKQGQEEITSNKQYKSEELRKDGHVDKHNL